MCAQVLPGPPVALSLDPDQGEHLAVTNAAETRARLLLRGAALQARDAHGNAAAAPGLRVRLSLRWPEGRQGERQFPCCWLPTKTILVGTPS